MGLVIGRSSSFSFDVTNVSVSTDSTTVTAGTSNADGTAVTLLSALSRDLHLITVGIGNILTSSQDNSALADLLYDPAGGTSWSSLVDDLLCGWSSTIGGAQDLNVYYAFPIWVPAGASIGMRIRKTGGTASSAKVRVYGFGDPANPDLWWCGQKVESLGIDASNSKGTDVTPGTSSSFGSWTAIGTSTRRYGALNFGIGLAGVTSVTANHRYNFEMGSGSARIEGTGTYSAVMNSGLVTRYGMNLHLVDIPASTALQARASDSGASGGQTPNVAFYGVY